jgi:hypothetical protein
MQTCPHCRKSNPDADAYCYACGHILPSAVKQIIPSTEFLDTSYEAMEPIRRWGTAYFQETSRLTLIFRDQNAVLVIPILERVVVGRSHDDPFPDQPDVDLTPYRGDELGVSRRHLAFVRGHNTISVIDLGSANSTFLNGQRLLPHEPRILRDNDELRLGRLVLRVKFR